MAFLRRLFMGVVVMAVAGQLQAQTTTQTQQPTAAAQFTVAQLSGEVVMVEGNLLLAKMRPGGDYRVFNVQPGRKFIIDGQTKVIGDLKPGTVLNAVVITTTRPTTVRTTTVTNGTVWYASGNYVIVTLENGENREFKVPASYKFTVEGKPASVTDLRKGMKVSGTRIVEEPRNEISTETTITGTAPK